MGGPSSGGSGTADERKQLTYSEQLERDRKKKQREEAERMARENRDGNQVKQKSVEQPKVKSQMNNTQVKSKEIVADKVAPTTVEVDQAEQVDKAEQDDLILLKNKKKGRKATVLTSVTGVEGYPTLSKKSLLGG